ncbi:MAG: hypothetical protein IIC04_11915, partial [Proteobacteria bacterium]|nr:hypothetical protein [Pseudomonadota bacterium]
EEQNEIAPALEFVGEGLDSLVADHIGTLRNLRRLGIDVKIQGLTGPELYDNANDETAAAYVVGDIRLGWHRVPIGSTALSPFVGVSNVLDRSYVAAVTPNAFGGRYFEPGPGRALGDEFPRQVEIERVHLHRRQY